MKKSEVAVQQIAEQKLVKGVIYQKGYKINNFSFAKCLYIYIYISAHVISVSV